MIDFITPIKLALLAILVIMLIHKLLKPKKRKNKKRERKEKWTCLKETLGAEKTNDSPLLLHPTFYIPTSWPGGQCKASQKYFLKCH